MYVFPKEIRVPYADACELDEISEEAALDEETPDS